MLLWQGPNITVLHYSLYKCIIQKLGSTKQSCAKAHPVWLLAKFRNWIHGCHISQISDIFDTRFYIFWAEVPRLLYIPTYPSVSNPWPPWLTPADHIHFLRLSTLHSSKPSWRALARVRSSAGRICTDTLASSATALLHVYSLLLCRCENLTVRLHPHIIQQPVHHCYLTGSTPCSHIRNMIRITIFNCDDFILNDNDDIGGRNNLSPLARSSPWRFILLCSDIFFGDGVALPQRFSEVINFKFVSRLFKNDYFINNRFMNVIEPYKSHFSRTVRFDLESRNFAK